MTLLLMASLIVMLYFSRKAVKQEAIQTASQTLEGTIQRIDNILLSVEQTTGNFYFAMLPYMHDPDKMATFTRQLVESNPYVIGCAIAFRDDYFRDRKHFMAYAHQTVGGSLKVETLEDGEYKKQLWYSKPMTGGTPGWQSPMTGDEPDQVPIITFCLPIPDQEGRPYAIMGVGVSIGQLSDIIDQAKPSPNSHCMLIDGDGSFIVHPDSIKESTMSVFSYSDNNSSPDISRAVEDMISGKEDYRHFRMNDTDYYLFFKPYQRDAVAGRSMEKLNWSCGILYPEKDIFGDYNDLLYYVLAIAVIGMLLLFLLSRVLIGRQLKPLLLLTDSAQRIAKGNYDEPIPDSRQEDEIGRLQDNFQQMQQALSTNIGQLEQLKNTLQERGESLRAAYKEAQKAERLKMSFLNNMTNHMVGPAEAIEADVNTLCEATGSRKPTAQLADDIQKNGHTIAQLLNDLINMSDEEKRKEATP